MLSVMNDLPDAQQPPVSPAHSTGTITRRFSKGFQSCLKGTRDDFDVDVDPSKSWPRPSTWPSSDVHGSPHGLVRREIRDARRRQDIARLSFSRNGFGPIFEVARLNQSAHTCRPVVCGTRAAQQIKIFITNAPEQTDGNTISQRDTAPADRIPSYG